MEKRLNKKIDTYISQFKEDIKEKVMQLGINDNEEMSQFVQFIYEYEQLSLIKEDFLKRKRVKNVVNLFDRCCAKRANGEQCTRRKKEEDEYCGTHMKGIPHGVVDSQEEPVVTNQQIEVWAQDIQGIIYYIDKANNVYQAEDIVANKFNPKVIAKYTRTGDNYTINL